MRRREGERGCGKFRARRRQADAFGTGAARRVEKVKRVDAVAAAALGEVKHAVENRQTAEVVILADLVGFRAHFRDRKTAHRRRRPGYLRGFRRARWAQDL